MGTTNESSDAEKLAGWFKAGSDPDDYECGADRNVVRQGSTSGFIRAKTNPNGFGTLMQMFQAASFRGQRHRLSAYIRTDQVTGSAGLWMRVDGPGGEILAFDNMQPRPIEGTLDWCDYQVVLDVPDRAQHIAFGVLLSGPGQVWIDDVRFDAVDDSVPVTSGMTESGYPAGPVNLDFEQLEN